jgi:hypothetical protein
MARCTVMKSHKSKAITLGEALPKALCILPSQTRGRRNSGCRNGESRQPRKQILQTHGGTTETVNRLSELEDFIRNMQSLVNPKPSLNFNFLKMKLTAR